MKVPIERYVQQVTDGSHYLGYIKIADTKLDYEFKFEIPIPRLDDAEPIETKEEVRRRYQISIKHGGTKIELTDDEYMFFFEMLAEFVVEFYNNPQTRGSQKGVIGAMIRGNGEMTAFGASASIGMRSNCSCNFPPNICEMLNAPKFGCALVA